MSQRYKLIQQSERFNGLMQSRDEMAKEYTRFLLEQERKCGPDGFVDSTRYRHPFIVRGREGETVMPKLTSMSRPQKKSGLDPKSKGGAEHKEQEHGIKFMEKVVSRGAETEHSMSNQIRTAEYEWRKQKNRVDDIQYKLLRLREGNLNQIRRSMALAQTEEDQLRWQMNKEKAKLLMYQNAKESSYWKLIHHRALQMENDHTLKEMQKEHRRCMNIKEKSLN
ncbi:uncharacterized protein LOC114647103 [Erpetoichthys calabaricus]|uniref:uncharacterized protein LOC114647103 n=1 Tax=Erpetoichthys calabaricus TaxID=27687 RepID=UPI002233F0B4|nr:uncharacterized protein LOC114647103 [Erpetoichthys calabaricus]